MSATVETESPGTGEAKRLKFPTALTVLAIVLLLVWIASFFIPAGLYETDPKTGSPVPGTYHELPDCGHGVAGPCTSTNFVDRFTTLWRATPSLTRVSVCAYDSCTRRASEGAGNRERA